MMKGSPPEILVHKVVQVGYPAVLGWVDRLCLVGDQHKDGTLLRNITVYCQATPHNHALSAHIPLGIHTALPNMDDSVAS